MNRNKIVLLAALALLMALTSILPVLAQDEGLLIWADDRRAPLLTELGAKFTEEFGIPVTVEQYGLGDARDQLLIRGPAGEGADIVIVAHDHLGQLVSNAAIDPMTTLSEDPDLMSNFNPAAVTLATYGGQLYGLPYATENVALVRNVDLVPEAPKTWQEVRSIAERFATDGTAQYAFVMQTGDAYHNFPIISAFGGYIFGLNDDKTFNVNDIGLNSPGGLAAGAWLQDMYANKYMPTDVNSDVALELFQNQDTAMWVTGPWNSKNISTAAETGGFAYSIDPLPGADGGMEQGAPFSGGQVFVLSAFSTKKLEAESFLLDYVATDEFMQALYDADPRLPAWKGVDTSTDPNVDAFIAAGTNAIPMPAIPEMGSVWSAAGNALTLISQGADAESTLNDAVSQINNAIALSRSTERIVVVAGSLQAALGCPADWSPDCLNTKLTDEDGDGVYTATFMVPAGDYEYKIALNAGWDENYGAAGAPGGDNIKLSVAADTEVTFSFDDNADPKVITDSVNNP